jgi:hypothetical protein
VSRFRLRSLVFVSALAVLARAQPSAEAEVLFTQGRELLEQERYAEACDKFEASRKIEASSGTVLNLAVCQQRLGRTASAWISYREAAALARRDDQADREQLAREQIAALEPKLTKLTIVVSSAADVVGLELERDGVEVARALWGHGIPVDPGEHRVRASAPGRKTWEQTVLAEGEGKSTSVEIPVLAEVAVPPRAPLAKTRRTPADSTRIEATPLPDRSGTTQRTLAFVAGGVGIAALGLTGYFAWRANDKDDQSRADCDSDDPNSCGDRGQELRADAQRAGNLATVFGIVGGVALTGAVVLYVTAPRPSESARRVELRVEGRRSGAAVVLGAPLF